MKYDRPVWQIMYECAAAMPEPFRYADVRGWFDRHYPEIGEATIRAHLVGMSEGGRPKHVQFAGRAPLFRRVDRGSYAVIPAEERKPDPDLPPDALAEGPADAEPPAPADPERYFAESAFNDARVVASGSAAVAGEPEDEDTDDVPPAEAAPPSEPGPEPRPVPPRDRSLADDLAADPAEPAVRAPGAHVPPRERSRARRPVTFEDLLRRTGLGAAATATEDPHGPLGARRRPDVPPEDTAPVELPTADVLLVGSDGERVVVPAPARETYRDESFQRARLAAQRTGVPWYVVSADAGLLEPHEWMSPDSRSLADLDPAYRQAWAQFVAARLAVVHGELDGAAIHLDAPAAFLGPLSAALHDAGAVVTFGAPGDAVARASAHAVPAPVPVRAVAEVREPVRQPVPEALAPAEAPERPAADGPAPLAVPSAAAVAAHLLEPANVLPATGLAALPDAPGLYAWHVDLPGARAVNRGLVLPFRPGLAYVGQAGAWGLGGARPGRGLRHLLADLQLAGRSRSSTFRLTLATILGDVLHLRSDDDPRLTAWMRDHLGVAVWPVDRAEDVPALLQHVTDHLEPPLNVDNLRSVAVRQRLSEIRAARA